MPKGTIATWKDEQGYGFIHPDDGGANLFVHISAVQHRQGRPKQGDRVRYTVEMNAQRGQSQAARVRIEGLAFDRLLGIGLGAWLLGGVVLALLALRVVEVPVLVIAYLALVLVFSPITFQMYGADKRRATAQQYRVSEATLHSFELIGGWPGALIAQHYFRHKVKKLSYQVIYWLIVAINVALVAALLR